MVTYNAPTWIGRTDANTNAATSTTLTINVPVGSQTGDLMVAFVHAQVGSTPTGSGSGTWTLHSSQARSGGVPTVYIFSKRLEAGESTVTFTFGGTSTLHYAIITTYRNVGSVGTVTQTLSSTSSTATGQTMPSVPVIYPNSIVFHQLFILRTTTGSVDWSANSAERSDTVSNSGGAWWLLSSADQSVSTPGSSPATTITVSSGNGSGTNGVLSSLVLNPINNAPVLVGRQDTKASANTTALSGNLPAGIQTGDVIVAYITYVASSAAVRASTLNASSGTGWTLIETSSSVNQMVYIYKKVYTAGDPTTVTVNPVSSGYGYQFSIFAFRNASHDNIVVGTRVLTTSTALSYAVPAINTASDENFIIGFANSLKTTTTSTQTHTWSTGVAKDLDSDQPSPTTSRRSHLSIAYAIDPDIGTFPSNTVTLSASTGTTAERYGIFLAVPPPPSASTYDGRAFLRFFVSGF